MMIRHRIWLVLMVLPALNDQLWGGGMITLILESRFDIPDIEIDDHQSVIHTQGLYVTQAHFFVTGRLEQPPKRALFLRFDRTDLDQYDVLDITPAAVDDVPATLDHPGGFDFDGQAFWIPVARSEPRGPTVMIRIALQPDTPFSEWKWQRAFHVDDHIGAIAWEPTQKRLYGANWDTKHVYSWTPRGDQIRESPRDKWLKDLPQWQLAIQDWKSVTDSLRFPPGTLVAGGIDKWPGRDRTKSAAVIEWIDPFRRKRLASVRLPSFSGYNTPVTREGLAIHQGRLYLLPGDIGRNALVFCYRFEAGRH